MTKENATNSVIKPPSIIKQALAVNGKPFPWFKAFCAGLAAALPVIIGLLLGNFEYGLIAGLGGLTYLYVFNVPYAQRAKKLFFVILGMTLVTALGTISAPYPLANSILMGIIGATVIFIFGALKISGPSAIFFILVFAMITGMPVQPELAPIRAGLVFLGGVLSFLIAMIGWISDPHGPEKLVVKRVYLELATLLDSVGTENFNTARHQVMSAVREAEENIVAGYIPWRKTDTFKRLYVLNDHANELFLYILENFADKDTKMPPELGETVRALARSIDQRHPRHFVGIHQPDQIDESIEQLFSKIYDADAIMNEPTSKINRVIRISKPSVKSIFMGTFDKNSIIFISSLRFGIVLAIAAIIAYQFEFNRSFWVPLSCCAVMSGFTIVATFHRAIQRSIGTIIGILIASLILATNPSGYVIALLILLLTFITELFIVKNYGLAALFFTPNALLMAESTSQGMFSFSYFASARLIDVFIGVVIGLIGVLLVGRRSASSRVPHLITKTIRSQAQFLLILFSDQGKGFDATESRESVKMQTNLVNLQTLYSTASGEIPVDNKVLDYYWPIIFRIGQLSYLLESCSKNDNRPTLSDDCLAQLLFVFETMANAIDRKMSPIMRDVPEIEGYPNIQKEIMYLQRALQIREQN